ncbi:MAG: PQQ-like beta-propeller repeat protein, partial [Phycisphaerae bacterium]|nr:PQQ-like beta-propeller repeat protein [Phycisphaerae bacterium]
MRRIAVMMALVLCASTAADWPTVRGNAARTGVAPSLLDSRSRVAWRTALTDSPTATCVEPIVAGGRVYVGALNGCVFALDADDGRVLWRFDVGGPVMHSPAWAPGPDRRGRLYVASIDGGLSCLDPATGRRLWQYDVGPGGFVASPTVMNTVIYIGARSGVFYAIRDGRGGPSLLWARDLGAPIWQTAAALDAEQHPDASGVFVMAEDRVARCLDDGDGTVLWASPRAGGQSARDYYPVVAGEWVFFVTRPADGAGAVIAAENDILARASKLELPLDARAVIQLRQRATEVPLKWRRRELFVVGKALEAEPGHQTMWAFRAEDGTPGRVPLLWGAGCGGVMSPPAVTPDGRAVVLWRSWYNGWSYDDRYAYASDSPLRGLGVLDPQTGMLSPLAASQGVGPAVGECFRVTNESAVLQVAGGRLLAVHQGAVTSLNLAGGPLRVILAGHDTWLGEA